MLANSVLGLCTVPVTRKMLKALALEKARDIGWLWVGDPLFSSATEGKAVCKALENEGKLVWDNARLEWLPL